MVFIIRIDLWLEIAHDYFVKMLVNDISSFKETSNH